MVSLLKAGKTTSRMLRSGWKMVSLLKAGNTTLRMLRNGWKVVMCKAMVCRRVQAWTL